MNAFTRCCKQSLEPFINTIQQQEERITAQEPTQRRKPSGEITDIGATRHKKPLRDEPNHHSCIADRKGTRVEESTVTPSAKAPAPLPAAALHRQKILDLQSGARRIFKYLFLVKILIDGFLYSMTKVFNVLSCFLNYQKPLQLNRITSSLCINIVCRKVL